MFREMMKSKLHQATVTEANLHYVGSITIDEELMEAADLLANEKVAVLSNTTGVRFETYVIAGPRGSRTICLNGAAARLVQPGDEVIILSYALMSDEQARNHRPRVVLLGRDNANHEILDAELHGVVASR